MGRVPNDDETGNVRELGSALEEKELGSALGARSALWRTLFGREAAPEDPDSRAARLRRRAELAQRRALAAALENEREAQEALQRGRDQRAEEEQLREARLYQELTALRAAREEAEGWEAARLRRTAPSATSAMSATLTSLERALREARARQHEAPPQLSTAALEAVATPPAQPEPPGPAALAAVEKRADREKRRAAEKAARERKGAALRAMKPAALLNTIKALQCRGRSLAEVAGDHGMRKGDLEALIRAAKRPRTQRAKTPAE